MSARTLVGLAAAIAIVASAQMAAALTPADWEGQPRIRMGKHSFAYVWRSARGLNVRVTSAANEDAKNWTGSVCSMDKKVIRGLRRVKIEKGQDEVTLDRRKRCIVFKLKTKGRTDGFEFRVPGSKRIGFSFRVDGSPLDTRNIFIGRNGLHPDHNPAILGPKAPARAPKKQPRAPKKRR